VIGIGEPNQEPFNCDMEIGLRASIYIGREYIGSFVNCGEFGTEAYDTNDVLFGVFEDDDAADALRPLVA
jgi:hypothetical protein